MGFVKMMGMRTTHVVLAALNAKYIHKNLALRWLYVSAPEDFEVSIVEGVIRDDPMRTADRILEKQPDFVGLSVYIFNAEETKRLIRCLLEKSPDLPIIVGGPEVTYDPNPWITLGVAAVVRGEGEVVFWEYLQGKSIQSIVTKEIYSDAIARVDLQTLEAFETPYFLPFDQEDMGKRYLYMETSRGCPYRCAYCLSSLEQGMRFFSISYIETLFNALKTSDVKQVKFLDRTFNVNPKQALGFAQQLRDLPRSISFHVELVGDTLSEALIEFFVNQEKGRFRVEIGVQSFKRETLLEVGRFSNLSQLKNVIRRFSEADVHQHTDLIAGLPFEDLASFKDSFNTLFSLNPFEIQVGILKLLHGTRLRENAEDYGYKFDSHSPYALRSSSWMSASDMITVERVAQAVEKTYNSQKLRKTLQKWITNYELNAFDLFDDLGKTINSLPRPYSQKEFFAAILAAVHPKVNNALIDLIDDYFRLSPIYPQPFWAEEPMTEAQKQLRKTIRTTLDSRYRGIKHLKVVSRNDAFEGNFAWVYPEGGQEHMKITFNKNFELESEIRYETPHRDA